MEKRKFNVFNIYWDVDECDGNDFLPPTETEVEIDSENVDDLYDDELCEEYISDYITDEYGFCHLGFCFEEIK